MIVNIDLDSALVNEKLEKIAQKQGNWTQELYDSGVYMLRSMDLNFAMQGRPTRWNPSLAAQKRQGMTLVDTGRLRRSVTSIVSGDTRWNLKKDSLSIGTNVPYGKYLQEERPFLMIQEQDIQNIINIFRNSIESL